MKKSNYLTLSEVVVDQYFAASNDVIQDVVRFADLKNATDEFKNGIKARLDHEIKASGLPVAEALKSLKDSLKAAGLDRRRISEVLISLGFRTNSATKPAEEDGRKAKAEALKAELAPTVEHLVAEALRLTGEDVEKAISALRRAHLTLQGRKSGAEAAAA